MDQKLLCALLIRHDDILAKKSSKKQPGKGDFHPSISY